MSIVPSILAAKSAGITPEQIAVLQAIVRLTRRRDGLRPTVREIADEVGVVTNDVYQKLVRLERDGWVERTAGVCRSVRVLRMPEET